MVTRQETVTRQQRLSPKPTHIVLTAGEQNITHCAPWHVFAGLPPSEAGNRARMGQVDKGKGQLSLETDTGFWWCEESGNTRLPFTGAVPNLYEAVVLPSSSKEFSIRRELH